MMSEKLRDEAREIALKISVGSKLASFHRGPEPTNKEYLLVAQQYLDLLRENGELREVIECMMCPVCDLNSNSEKSEK